MVRLDTDPLQTPADADGNEAKMFASAHLSSAVAGVSRNGRHPATVSCHSRSRAA